MSTSIELCCILQGAEHSSQEFLERVLQTLDEAGLKYHFYGDGGVQTWRTDEAGPLIEMEQEKDLPRRSAERVVRAAKLLLSNRGRRALVVDLDCRESTESALLSISEAPGFPNVWMVWMSVESRVTYTEEDDGRQSCFEHFVRLGILPLFDTGIGLIGYAGFNLGDPSKEFVSSILEGRIPDVFPYNIYPSRLAEANGLHTQRGRERLSREASVLHETPRGSLLWEVKKATEEFDRISPADRLVIFGLAEPDQMERPSDSGAP